MEKIVDRNRAEPLTPQDSMPEPFLADALEPSHYLLEEGLEDAVNVALQLGQPLLLTGEPGTGKTQFAQFLSWHLGLKRPFEFHTKSSSVATDLFYSFDVVRRFHAAQTNVGSQDDKDYIRYNALGLAVLQSLSRDDIRGLCSEDEIKRLAPEPARSIVLVDEIDKASRDFPNDLLNELANMSFRVSELRSQILADAKYRPIVIITSNGERSLPEPFLRRCIFYNIAAPDAQRLLKIVSKRFGFDSNSAPPLLRDSVHYYIGAKNRVVRPPSTAEFVGWFQHMRALGAQVEMSLSSARVIAAQSLSALAKNVEDRKTLQDLLSSL